MPEIQAKTVINAPIERCFDLARSIDFHEFTSASTGEKAIAGITKGLINEGEEVTWRAKHFGISQTLTSKITRCERPFVFEDQMLKGAFKSICHLHTFEFTDGQTIMTDIFVFESPLGIFGKIFNRLVLTAYMKKFIDERNRILKQTAESEEWKKFIKITA
ncbi:MAG: SRPBCC family protein [Bacteroidia bacterium]